MESTKVLREKELAQARKFTRSIALGHYENFPVGSVLIPRKLRQHFYNLYAYMRTADDFADLPERPSQERLKLLANWRRQLLDLFDGKPSEDPVFMTLNETVSKFHLEINPLASLLGAFEFDAKGNVNFNIFNDLHWYTQRSAEPVGQLILALFGYHDFERIDLSNNICSALQLINFIQDAEEDIKNGRCYFPKEDWPSGTSLADLQRPEVFSATTGKMLTRILEMLRAGSQLPEMVDGRLKFELRCVLIEAKKMCRKIGELGGNTVKTRPKLSKSEHLASMFQAFLGPVKI
jgi:squalene synthase HpnC